MLNGVELVVEARLKYFKGGLCWLSQLAVTEELESGDVEELAVSQKLGLFAID